MQADRRLKMVSTILVALAAAGASSSWGQTSPLRPPVSALGSGGRLGSTNSPANPASSPAMGSLQNTPALLQAPQAVQQAPLSKTPPLAPISVVTPQAQTVHPQANVPDARKVRQVALPQRAQCLTKFVLEGLWAGPTAVALTCEVQDQWVLMEFVVPTKQVFDVLAAAQKAGFSLWIDYEDSAAAAEGNPKRQMQMVGAHEAYQSFQHVVCMGSGDRRSLQVPPRGNQAYPQFTTWCTDGKRVTPVTFASDKNSWALMLTNIEDGAVAIDYQLVMGGRHPKTGVVRPYPIERISVIPGNNIKQAGGDPVLARGSRWCRSDYVGAAGAAGCIGLTARSQMFGSAELAVGSKTLSEPSTVFNTFFDRVAMEDSTPYPKSGGTYKKFFNYYMLPGVVPPEFRNLSKGACRVALYRDVSFSQTSSGIGVGKASTDEDMRCKAGGNPSAVWGQANGDGAPRCWNSQSELNAENNRRYLKSNPDQAPKPAATPTPDTCQLLQQ